MIRITATEETSQITVTIDGELSRAHVAAVETSCREAKLNGKPVQLFLRDVTSVDQAGQTLLRKLAATGVGLLAKGVYTSYLVETLGTQQVKNFST